MFFILRNCFLLVFLAMIYAQSSMAQEITIVDAQGLIRLKVISAEPISVEIKFECNPLTIDKPTVVLSHEDGLLGDTELPWTSPCGVEAKNIPAGRWRVRSFSGDELVKLSLVEVIQISPSKD